MLFEPNQNDPLHELESALDATQPNAPVRIAKRRRFVWVRETLQLVAMGVVIYLLVNVSTARASILGPSMRPNFETGQVVIVNRLAYVFGNPARGDVVVVENPAERCKAGIDQRPLIPIPFVTKYDTNNGDCDDLFKRVIGLPGEVVEARQGKIFINGKQIDEPYVVNIPTGRDAYDGRWELGPEQYFVLGDNRPSSYDSHSFGPVDRKLLYGKAWIRYWPLEQIEVIPQPSYK